MERERHAASSTVAESNDHESSRNGTAVVTPATIHTNVATYFIIIIIIWGSSNRGAEPEFGLFNPFFRDPATPAGTGTAATKTAVEFDPLVPNSTPVDQSVLDSEHGFNVDLLAALNQASFGSPQFPSPGSQSSPDASAAAAALNTDDTLAQLLKFDDSPSAEMDPQYGGVELPRSSLNSDLDSAVDVAMQLARVSVNVGDARPSEGTDSDSDSSLSELSD